jgi:hypothetical protein
MMNEKENRDAFFSGQKRIAESEGSIRNFAIGSCEQS